MTGCALDTPDPAARTASCDALSQQVYASPDAELPALTAEMAELGCQVPEVTDDLAELVLDRTSAGADRADLESVAQSFYNLSQLEPDRFPTGPAPLANTRKDDGREIIIVIVGRGGPCVRHDHPDTVVYVCSSVNGAN